MINSRFSVICVVGVGFVAATVCCRGKHERVYIEDDTQPNEPQTVVRMSDRAAVRQLVSGFFDLTANTWRWTGKRFSVVLASRLQSERGATLSLAFTLPEAIFTVTGPVTLSASIGGSSVGSQMYSAPGLYEFTKHVDPKLVEAKSSVQVDFLLDKAMPPKPPETRELGLIVTQISLTPK